MPLQIKNILLIFLRSVLSASLLYWCPACALYKSGDKSNFESGSTPKAPGKSLSSTDALSSTEAQAVCSPALSERISHDLGFAVRFERQSEIPALQPGSYFRVKNVMMVPQLASASWLLIHLDERQKSQEACALRANQSLLRQDISQKLINSLRSSLAGL